MALFDISRKPSRVWIWHVRRLPVHQVPTCAQLIRRRPTHIARCNPRPSVTNWANTGESKAKTLRSRTLARNLDEIAFPIWTPDGQLEWHELVVVRECLSSSSDHFLQDRIAGISGCCCYDCCFCCCCNCGQQMFDFNLVSLPVRPAWHSLAICGISLACQKSPDMKSAQDRAIKLTSEAQLGS